MKRRLPRVKPTASSASVSGASPPTALASKAPKVAAASSQAIQRDRPSPRTIALTSKAAAAAPTRPSGHIAIAGQG